MITQILVPVGAMAALGLIFGVGLGYALKLFGIEVDPTTFMILSKLPGSNCGACGKAGCAGFAEALRKGEAMPSGCVVSNDEARKSIAELLGVEHQPKVRLVATLLCNGGNKNAKDKFIYKGIKTCKANSLVLGGHKACDFGCLGHADCVRVCPFDALKMGSDDLPVVDPDKCTACGNCVRECPNKIFKLLPIDKLYYVKCSSLDPGNVTMKVCKTGCIACFKCQKVCPTGAAVVAKDLSTINCDKCENYGKCCEVCPTKVIIKRG